MQNKNTESPQYNNDNSNQSSEIEYSQSKKFSIPLMSKKMNSIEKYVKMYHLPQRNDDNSSSNYRSHLRQQSVLSDHGSRLVYGGKITPDINYNQLQDNKCYIKYSSLQNYGTQERLALLDNMGSQYQRLKNGLSQREPFLSKYSLPSSKKYASKNISTTKILQQHQFKPQQINSQLKKSIILQKGKRYFADLYMLKNQRDKIKEEAIKGISPSRSQDSYTKQQAFIIEKKKKQLEQRKKKMMKNKGLNWNVYYQTLALTKNQKKNLKSNNSKFVQSYGTD